MILGPTEPRTLVSRTRLLLGRRISRHAVLSNPMLEPSSSATLPRSRRPLGRLTAADPLGSAWAPWMHRLARASFGCHRSPDRQALTHRNISGTRALRWNAQEDRWAGWVMSWLTASSFDVEQSNIAQHVCQCRAQRPPGHRAPSSVRGAC